MYGSSRFRAYYGAGDYQRAASFVRGYYPGGGFLSGLVSKVGGLAGKVLSNPLVQTGLSFVPGGGIIAKGAQLAGRFLGSGSGAAMVAGGAKKLLGAGVKTLATGTILQAGSNLIGGGGGGASIPSFNVEKPNKPKRRRSTRRRASSRRSSTRSRRRGRRYYRGGDLREASGRWTSQGNVSQSYPHKGHYHPPKRRRRRRGGGRRGRVSFTTRDGRKVSF
jgi:hypothetical protein